MGSNPTLSAIFSMALRAARQRLPDPTELVLAELWAVRYALLNLFHAAARAASEGRHLLPNSILKIRDQAVPRKLHRRQKDGPHPVQATGILHPFLSSGLSCAPGMAAWWCTTKSKYSNYPQ
ncbi:MAG: hypothetical protein WBW01_09230 [Terriglobales bacterium]